RGSTILATAPTLRVAPAGLEQLALSAAPRTVVADAVPKNKPHGNGSFRDARPVRAPAYVSSRRLRARHADATKSGEEAMERRATSRRRASVLATGAPRCERLTARAPQLQRGRVRAAAAVAALLIGAKRPGAPGRGRRDALAVRVAARVCALRSAPAQ